MNKIHTCCSILYVMVMSFFKFYFVPISLELFTQYVVCLNFGFNVFTFAISSSDYFDHSIQKNSIFSRRKKKLSIFSLLSLFCHFRLLPIIPCINSRQNKFLNDTVIKVTIFLVPLWDDRKLFYAISTKIKKKWIHLQHCCVFSKQSKSQDIIKSFGRIWNDRMWNIVKLIFFLETKPQKRIRKKIYT